MSDPEFVKVVNMGETKNERSDEDHGVDGSFGEKKEWYGGRSEKDFLGDGTLGTVSKDYEQLVTNSHEVPERHPPLLWRGEPRF
jgi:hypothetical protein